MLYFIGFILKSFCCKSVFELGNWLSTCLHLQCNFLHIYFRTWLFFIYFLHFFLNTFFFCRKNFKLDLSSSTCSTFISRFELWWIPIFLRISTIKLKNLKQSWSYSLIITYKEKRIWKRWLTITMNYNFKLNFTYVQTCFSVGFFFWEGMQIAKA